MTFDQIPSGTEVFLDANTLIYHFTAEPSMGAACTRLIERIEQGDLRGHTSAAVLSDAAHRMMTIEAMNRNGWPISGLAARLQKHHAEIATLTLFQQPPSECLNLAFMFGKSRPI
jgi:predicted nucleic acid-binding protein